MATQSSELKEDIDAYANLSVPFRSQMIQQQKHAAFSKRFAELVDKFRAEQQEIHIKMTQYLDLAKRRATVSGDMGDTADEEAGLQTKSQVLAMQLDQEELKIQGEAAYMEDVIAQRQEELNNAEKLMGDINEIAKDINTKVHEQRTDLIEINTNVGEALDNAKEAEKNIEEAQEHQKKGGRCMYWIVTVVAVFVIALLVIMLIALL